MHVQKNGIVTLVFLGIVITLIFLSQGNLAAQVTNLECGEGEQPIGYLGISGLKCQCTYFAGSDPEEKLWYFQSEPKILKVDTEGPAADILKSGDVIVAINGTMITTRTGGWLFSNPTPGDSLEFLVRRGDNVYSHVIVPGQICPEDPKASTGADTQFGESLRHLAITLESLSNTGLNKSQSARAHDDSLAPRGWLGLGMSCSGCCVRIPSADDPPQWHFDSAPKVYSVDEDSPAGKAGFRSGDIITHIDGLPLDTEEGGTFFSEVQPGQKITWTILRDEKNQFLKTIAELPPMSGTGRKPHNLLTSFQPDGDKQKILYTGSLGDTDVEVQGSMPVVVSVYESRGEIIIDMGETVVKLHSKQKTKN